MRDISGLNHVAFDLAALRSDGRPPPRKTRFPAAGPALPDGIGYPQGFNERFHIFEMILLSRASWRKVKLGQVGPGRPGWSPTQVPHRSRRAR